MNQPAIEISGPRFERIKRHDFGGISEIPVDAGDINTHGIVLVRCYFCQFFSVQFDQFMHGPPPPEIMIRMLSHMLCISYAVQMNIAFRGSSAPVSENRLGDVYAGSLIDLCGCCMTEKVAVKMFFKPEISLSFLEDILN